MEDTLPSQDEFAILANAKQLDDSRPHVLKDRDTFAIFNHYGDINPAGKDQGVFHEGTRFLSEFRFHMGGQPPLILSSVISPDNHFLNIDLTNQDIRANGQISIRRGTIHVFRSKFLWRGVVYDRLRWANYGLAPVDVSAAVRFNADFADIFEVRGTIRPQRGKTAPPEQIGKEIVLSYAGLDQVTRRLRIACSEPNVTFHSHTLAWTQRLNVKEEVVIDLICACETSEQPAEWSSVDEAAQELRSAHSSKVQGCRLETTHFRLNEWLRRSQADVNLMLTETRHGPYPYAGIPWFSTVFGRDGLLTAYFMLWMQPAMARGVLSFLAAHQARERIPNQDAEPGKILHELRQGEMAALGEVPFGRYYGSVDSTPLFVFLAGAYYQRTGDLPFVRKLWPHVISALRWIDREGDLDQDGFVEYCRQTPHGLAQQGWKDSSDSVFHRDGSLAEGPIALCEVQAYVYAAKQGAAQMADALGQPDEAARLRDEARALKRRFEEKFWSDELGTYILALDGYKRPCEVRTSNAGHCLFAGIADPERARRTAETLMSRTSFSGWGIRTVDARELRYNPMAYHNGSIWPHDNAVISLGFQRYGFREEIEKVFCALFDASQFMALQRLPEFYCGFHRRKDEAPTLYPVACSPQAWASASVFALFQAMMGIEIQLVPEPRVNLASLRFPEFLNDLALKDLTVGKEHMTLRFNRQGRLVRLESDTYSVPVSIDNL